MWFALKCHVIRILINMQEHALNAQTTTAHIPLPPPIQFLFHGARIQKCMFVYHFKISKLFKFE